MIGRLNHVAIAVPDLDAAALHVLLSGLLPPDDPRAVATVEAVAETLGRQSISVTDPDRVVEAMRVVTLRLLGQEAEMTPPPSYAVPKWLLLGVGVAGVVLRICR